jgi:hypothetical protein
MHNLAFTFPDPSESMRNAVMVPETEDASYYTILPVLSRGNMRQVSSANNRGFWERVVTVPGT